jgi:hypothetical protein
LHSITIEDVLMVATINMNRVRQNHTLSIAFGLLALVSLHLDEVSRILFPIFPIVFLFA